MEMNNRDEMEVKLEILQKENQEIKLLMEQERTLRNLEIEGAKKKEAMLKAYTETAAELFKQNVKVKTQEIEHNILRGNNEDLDMRYGMLQRSHKKVDAKTAALQKTNQELKQQKERCLEEKSVEIAALRERNQELKQLKEHCVEEEAKMAALLKDNQTLKQEKERSVEEKVDKKENEVKVEPEVSHNVKMNVLKIEQKVLRGNYEEVNMKYEKLLKKHQNDKAEDLKQLEEPCVEEKDAEMAALQKTNHELKQEKLRCVEVKNAEIVVLHERNHELEEQKERCVEEKDAEIATLHERNHKLEQQKERFVEEKDAEIAALLKENQTLKQEKEHCVEKEARWTRRKMR
ncbi:hypothetical protein JOQ06_011418 [Pogonophryne albipinna]|uniref:Uncharacterized protein n=1 Tax=Pogonophryne albipinna TaxID=1090488 RepID=A0AAD6BG83_9TELE|nr:hypothetical protein JOQ06_011418 [Pogonophryne albipinna]